MTNGYKRHRRALLASAVAMAFAAPVPAIAQVQTFQFNIPAQPLDASLRALARTSRQQILFDRSLVRGRTAPALVGSFSVEEGLRRLLANSGLAATRGSRGAYVVSPLSGEAEAGGAAADNGSADAGAVAEILVIGSRSQNVDIRRSEDDPQPYVVLDRTEIDRSQARTVQEFLQERLPMNARTTVDARSNSSAINLRGLGISETLVLVDGRRVPRQSDLVEGFTQGDVNGIPLDSIERIEILPATASGIYGGGATGGVVNIIRRRDYNGVDLRTSFSGAFRGGAETFRIDLSGGFSLNAGRTQISFAGSHQAAAPLLSESNGLQQRATDLYASNGGPINFAGSTPNIMSSNGAQLVLDDGTPLNSTMTFVPFGYSGVASDNGRALLANAGRSNTALPRDRRSLLGTGSYPRLRSANLNVRQEVTQAIDIFADVTYADNLNRRISGLALQTTLQPNAINNPFRQPIRVFFPSFGLEVQSGGRTRSLYGSAGVIARLGGSWVANAEYGWSRIRSVSDSLASPLSSAATTAFANGSLDVVRDLSLYPLDYSAFRNSNLVPPVRITTSQELMSARISGGLFELPGGVMTLTGLVERRLERAQAYVSASASSSSVSYTFIPRRAQSVSSGYVELRAPLISPRNSIPAIRSLELQAAIRHDRYATRAPTPSQIGIPTPSSVPPVEPEFNTTSVNSTDFTVALLWSPARDLTLRGSYSTGFLAPNISQLTPTTINLLSGFGLRDILRGSEIVGSRVPAALIFGGNPDLQPERSETWSAGLILSPSFLPGLRISVDYNLIRKTDEIGSLGGDQNVIANEAIFPERIVRGPNLPGDPAGWPGPIVELNNTSINLSRTRVQAIDVQLDYHVRTEHFGIFRFYIVGTHQREFWRRLRPELASVDLAGFNDGPLRWRGNGGLDWTSGPWAVSWNVQYYHSYSVRNGSDPTSTSSNQSVQFQGSERVPAQIYNDISVSYRFSSPGSMLNGVRIAAGVRNVLDVRPPSFAFGRTFSPYGDPRLRSYTLTISRHF